MLPPITPYSPYGSSGSYNGNGAYAGNGAYGGYDGPNRLRPVCQKSKDRSKFRRNFYFIFIGRFEREKLILFRSFYFAVDGRVFVHRKCAWV